MNDEQILEGLSKVRNAVLTADNFLNAGEYGVCSNYIERAQYEISTLYDEIADDEIENPREE